MAPKKLNTSAAKPTASSPNSRSASQRSQRGKKPVAKPKAKKKKESGLGVLVEEADADDVEPIVEATAELRVAESSTDALAMASQLGVSVDAQEQQGVPERLTLGLTIEAIEALLAALPADAVEECNAANSAKGFDPNADLNGYVNQFHIAKQCEVDGLSTCERLRQQGHPGVGTATIFVSWPLATPLATLLDGMRQYLEHHSELPRDTKWWVCDFVIRQGAAAKADVALLGECVSAVGHTVLLMEPWHDPMPLKRAYCIKEVYHTQASGAQFAVVMSREQQAAFSTALTTDFDSIATQLSRVDVRTAECRKRKETDAILGELDREVGLVECNKVVHGLLNGALVALGKGWLVWLPAGDERRPGLLNNLGRLLQDQGNLDGAAPLILDALQGYRETLGDRHADTLSSIANLGSLLCAKGDLNGAAPLLREALQVSRETLGDRHKDTLAFINNLGMLLMAQGDLDGAVPLLGEALKGRRETLGDRHQDTLRSIGNLGAVLMNKGDLSGAAPLLREALQACRETLGDRHPNTLKAMNNLGTLLRMEGDLDGAAPLYREALKGSRETLGDRHPNTLISISSLGVLLMNQGDLDGAAPLLREALQVMRETLGDRHPDTLAAIDNLGSLLYTTGDLVGAAPLFHEALKAKRETLGDRHDYTLASINNLSVLLQAQGDLDGAAPLFREALQVRRESLGDRHPDTLISINNLGMLLHAKGDLDGAVPLLREALQGFRETLGDAHPNTSSAINNLAALLIAAGESDSAIVLVRQKLEVCAALYGLDHALTRDTAVTLVRLLRKAGREEEAKQLAGQYRVRYIGWLELGCRVVVVVPLLPLLLAWAVCMFMARWARRACSSPGGKRDAVQLREHEVVVVGAEVRSCSL